MKNTGTLEIATPTDREIVMTRVFDAPRRLVFDAFFKPELLKRWFGPRGWSLSVCEIDYRVGGGFRFVLRGPDGKEMGMRGVYRELAPPDRSVHMESFDDYPGESQVTTVFVESGGKTTMTVTVRYPSKEVRDAVVRSGMEHGAAESYDRLAEMLAPGATLQITTPTGREIAMSRVFNAPRQLVFDAMTKPELIRKWLLGPDGWTMPICEVDLRVGGAYRYVWRRADGKEMGMGGVYREVVPPERIVSTEVFDKAWYAGEAVGTHVLTEQNGQTTLTQTMLYDSQEIRDGVLKSGMESGVAVSYDRLAAIVEKERVS